MLNCIIVDDEPNAIKVLKTHVAASGGMLNLLHATTSPAEALAFVNQHPVQLAFLDIEMPRMNGVELAKALQGKCKVVFTTGHTAAVSDAFDLQGVVVDYLLKPIDFPRFLRAVQRAINSLGTADLLSPQLAQLDQSGLGRDYIFVKGEHKGKMQQIYLANIDYIEAMRNYMAIYHNGQKTMVLMSMKDMEAHLPTTHFIRVQKSFIVGLHEIAAVEGNRIKLKSWDVEITIGDSYKAQFVEAVKGKVMR
jgi:two-component system, LytTR family, response regulator